MADIYQSIFEIVGREHASTKTEELYFYARDAGLMPAHKPDCVVAPKTTEEVQRIVKLANEEKIPVVPMGGGMSLSGLTVPLKGGIVIDMKRMNKILEVNRISRYVVVEGGTSEGALKAYLERNYPDLCHSIPDAPPMVSVAANAAIHGQGNLAQQYGFNSDMVSGLEVVLPTGEICKIGSCSMSPYWFSKGPSLPDLSGLFLGWLGTTGIITKLGLKLYPKKKMRDVQIFVTDRGDLVPEILYKLTHTEMAENIDIWTQPKPLMFKGHHHITLMITGDSDEELEFKRRMVWDSLKEFRDSKDGGFMWVTPSMKPAFLDLPNKISTGFADQEKGGGFVYTGPVAIVEKYSLFVEKLEELANKYKIRSWAGYARVIGRNHCMMFCFNLPFNRADPEMMERVKKVEREAIIFALDQGAIPWKPNLEEQKLAMERMDRNILKLMRIIKEKLDPNKIMNPD
jgi:glycolate oxidase